MLPNFRAHPPEKLTPVTLGIVVELLARTATVGPINRIPKVIFTDLVFMTIGALLLLCTLSSEKRPIPN
jgi:hypothetical protein